MLLISTFSSGMVQYGNIDRKLTEGVVCLFEGGNETKGF